ncbi:hypothetical protein [Actinomadura verrucosospora]
MKPRPDDPANGSRLRWRDDAYAALSPTGTAVLTHRGTTIFTQPGALRWIERLMPHLDGRHTLAELTADLPPDRARYVERLVTALLDADAVRGAAEAMFDPGDSPQGAAAAHRGETTFLSYFSDAGPQAFQRYRDSTALVLGAGPLLPAALRAAYRTGLRKVHAVVTAESPTDEEALYTAARTGTVTRGGPPACISWYQGVAETEAELARLLGSPDLIVHCAGRPLPERARLIDRLCERGGAIVVQMLLAGDDVWLGQAGCPGPGRPGASAALHRLTRPGDEHAPSGQRAAERAGVAAAANRAVHDLFRRATNVAPSSDRPHLTRVTGQGLDGGVHHFLPHPLASPAAPPSTEEFIDHVLRLQQIPALAADDFSRRAAACSDPRLGVIGEVSEGDLPQLPLHMARSLVSDPVGLLEPGGRAPVTAVGTDFTAARHRTAMAALAAYTSLMVDPRRLLTASGRPLLEADAAPSAALATLTGPGPAGVLPATAHASSGFVHTLCLKSGRPHRLPAAVAFPALRRVPGAYRTPCGVAAAHTWTAALQMGLLQHCEQLTVSWARSPSRPPLPQIDPESIPQDATVRWCLPMALALGLSLTVHDLTGPLGVPVLACRLGDRLTAYGSGTTYTRALGEGLLQLLASWQTPPGLGRSPGHPWHGEPAMPPGRLGDRIIRPVRPRPAPPVSDLVAALTRSGLRVLAVPLDHDPQVHALVPFTVHVVVTHDSP